MNYISELFTDPSFMGALLGAIVTGLIAISVFYLQKRNADKKEKQHYKKVYAELQKNLDITRQSSEIFKNLVLNRDFNKDTMSVCVAAFNLVSALLQKIEVKDIPYEIHSDFFKLKDALVTIKLCSEVYNDVKDLSFLRKDFLDSVTAYNISLLNLEKFYNK